MVISLPCLTNIKNWLVQSKRLLSNDPPLSRGYTLGSGEDSLKLMELMAYCTNLYELVSKKNREIKKGISSKDENQAKIDKTEHGMEKMCKSRPKS
ncbi:hypothetical protein Tco_0409652 [Tanacetum coccineum]